MICKYLLPFSRLSFCFVDGFLCCSEAFWFDVVPLVYFCFCCPCLRRHILTDIAKTIVKEHTAYVFFLGVLQFQVSHSGLYLEVILVLLKTIANQQSMWTRRYQGTFSPCLGSSYQPSLFLFTLVLYE